LALDRLGDWYYGIDTTRTGALPRASESSRFGDVFVNGPVSYGLLWRFVDRATLRPEDVFYDVGCGDGRVLCFVARQPVARCVGIELSAEFAARANRNAARLRGRRAPIEVRVGDAAQMDYEDGTVFYFGDPFGGQTMREVLRRIGLGVQRHPRPARCIFVLRRGERAEVVEAVRTSGWLSFAERRGFPFSPMVAEFWVFAPDAQRSVSSSESPGAYSASAQNCQRQRGAGPVTAAAAR